MYPRIRNQILPAALTAALLCLLAWLAGQSAAVTQMLQARTVLCLQTLIPSLFGCMALCDLLTASGAAAWLGTKLRHPAKLLRIPPEVLCIFLVSQIAGYPVGTVLLRRMTEQGRLSGAAAAKLSCVCFGGGPAFLVGLAGVQLFGSAAAGWLMLGACVLANCILLVLTCRSQDSVSNEESAAAAVRLNAECITSAVSRTMRSLAGICGMVLLFGILTLLCDFLGIIALSVRLGGAAGISEQTVRAFFAAFMDVTALQGLFFCGLPFRPLLAISAGMLSFGGICVHWQCLALGSGTVSARRLLCIRLSAALLTALITYAAAGAITLPEAAEVFAHSTKLTENGSVLPALMIFLTGFPFLIKKD
ncbi:MAG: hypothetical protein IKQ91_10910 [Oscillospiraceae bacterium]|nr:hypothetical protein [Oscillospiraceae bacterium]